MAVEGMVAGAVYTPAEEMVPTVELPPTVPLTSQLIAVLLVPETVALNACDRLSWTLALAGEIPTDTAAAVTETDALAEAVDWAALRAVTVTEPAGTEDGAV
jgi:hypothetical protein